MEGPRLTGMTNCLASKCNKSFVNGAILFACVACVKKRRGNESDAEWWYVKFEAYRFILVCICLVHLIDEH